jgi:hypothetical protein
MNVSGLDVIARSNDFEAAATRFELRPWQWNFLHALDGHAELRDLAAQCGLDVDAAISFVKESEETGLVRVVSMSLLDYRAWSGVADAATAVVPASEDHFSTSDSLGGYATTVPSWMIAPAHYDEPTDNGQAEWTPDFHNIAPADVQDDEPAADVHHDEPVAEVHHDEPVAEVHHDEPVAEDAHDEWVPEFHQDAPVEEAAHDEWLPEFHQDAPVAETHDEEPVAQDHAQEWSTYSHDTDAAQAVANLVGVHDADHAATEAAPEAEHAPVSLSFGEPEPSAFSSNGHSYDSTWEPMSLVTAVDPGPMPDEYEQHAEAHHEPEHDDMGGISISLGASPETVEPEAYDHTPVHEAAPSRGISFSLSPDMAAPWNDASPETHHDVPAEESHHDVPAAESHYDVPTEPHYDAPVAEHDAPIAEQSEAVAAHAEPVTQSAETATTADIVGSLIARALTFRIK